MQIAKTIDKIATDLDAGKRLFIFYAYKGGKENYHSIEELKNRYKKVYEFYNFFIGETIKLKDLLKIDFKFS